MSLLTKNHEKSYETKPYNVCVDCIHLGVSCDGPNFLAMTPDRWCEWCRLRKEYLGWTSTKIAEHAEVSQISVARVMSGDIKDMRVTTMQAITKALVNGSWGQYPCAMAATEENNHIKEAVDSINAIHEAELNEVRTQEQAKINYLMEQIRLKDKQIEEKDSQMKERADFLRRKDKTMIALASLLVVAIGAIIALLAVM